MFFVDKNWTLDKLYFSKKIVLEEGYTEYVVPVKVSAGEYPGYCFKSGFSTDASLKVAIKSSSRTGLS